MNKKIITKIAIWSTAVIAVLVSILIVHIYLVTQKSPNLEANNRQLSRIDFKQDIDTVEAEKIKGFVKSLSGVDGVYFNIKDEILVYTYEVGKQNSAFVFNKLIAFGKYKAVKYEVTKEQAENGCPIGKEKSSLIYKITSLISKINK